MSMFASLFTKKPKRVFLDYASATPMRLEVQESIRQYDRLQFANPSALYKEAREAKEALDTARKEVARFLNTTAEQIVFTSGGTEANNIALQGVFRKAKASGINHPHIISVTTEHSAIKEVLPYIKREGGSVTLLSPDHSGRISVSDILQAITTDTVLISVMYINNEIGVLQPVREIVQKVKEYRKEHNTSYPYVHTDACQAPLWYRLDISILGVDLLSLDGLKIGGPRGIGCLFVRQSTPIESLVFGGGQEKGLRSGTEPVGLCVGFAKALTLAQQERDNIVPQVQTLRDKLLAGILVLCPDASVNGSMTHRAPNNLNVCFPSYDAEYLVVTLDVYGVSVSYSSSCLHLKEDSTSYVIDAINPTCKHSSIRFTLGRDTTEDDITSALDALKKALVQVKL